MSLLQFKCPVGEIRVGDLHVDRKARITVSERSDTKYSSMQKLSWDGVAGAYSYSREYSSLLIERDSVYDTDVSLEQLRNQILRSDSPPLPTS